MTKAALCRRPGCATITIRERCALHRQQQAHAWQSVLSAGEPRHATRTQAASMKHSSNGREHA